MFEVNEQVMYGTNGVCTITDITTKKVGRQRIEYYVLKPVGAANSTLFVPTQNEALVSKMRNVLTEEEISDILSERGEPEGKWIDNKNERFEVFKSVVSEGESNRLLKLIRSIHNHEVEQASKGKKLHMSDEKFLKEAEKMLCGEFSLVLKMPYEQVLSIILS